MVVLLESLDEGIGIVGRVVVDNVGWVVRVDLVDVLLKLAALLGLNFLNLLEATALDEGSLGFEVGGKHLGELSADIGKDVVWCEL